jgi:Fic family protein
MNFILIAAGYPPVSIAPDLRAAYYAALEAADAGDPTAFLTFISARLNDELDTWLEALEETEDRRPLRSQTEEKISVGSD